MKAKPVKVNPAAEAAAADALEYREIGRLDDHVLTVLRATARTLPFHAHEDSDEMFFVVEDRVSVMLVEKAGTLNGENTGGTYLPE